MSFKATIMCKGGRTNCAVVYFLTARHGNVAVRRALHLREPFTRLEEIVCHKGESYRRRPKVQKAGDRDKGAWGTWEIWAKRRNTIHPSRPQKAKAEIITYFTMSRASIVPRNLLIL